MTGADLRCPTCSAGAADVAADVDLSGMFRSGRFGLQWTCANGHHFISGVRRIAPGVWAPPEFEHMAVAPRGER